MPILLLPTSDVGAPAAIPYTTRAQPAPADAGKSWWGQRERRDLSLLSTALLENVLLGGAETPKRVNVPATHVDRREVPQQRLLESVPGLLDTALLEVPSPGPSQPAATHLRPNWLRVAGPKADQSSSAAVAFDPTQAGYGATWRWWRDPAIPAQRDRKSATGFLDPGLLEIPPPPPAQPAVTHLRVNWLRLPGPMFDQSSAAVITGFDPTQAGYGTAWRWRRDPYPPTQRQYVSAYTLLDTALLENELLGGAGTWLREIFAAAYTDRREVPTQRGPLSTIDAVTGSDPTQAGYAPGRWWRDPSQPRQRYYVSDPSLLATALLENELLGGAEAFKRAAVAATHADRRMVPAQRRAKSLPDVIIAFDPTQAGYGRITIFLAVTHADRRLYPAQRIPLVDQGSAVLYGTSATVSAAGPSSLGVTATAPGSTSPAVTGAASTGSAGTAPTSTTTDVTGPTSRGV